MSLPQFEWNPYTPAYATKTDGVSFDCQANDPQKLSMLGVAAPTEGRPCRWVTASVTTPGTPLTLIATRPDGVAVTLVVVAVNQTFNIQAITLAGTAVGVSVYW